jgi:hypothetical protein
LLKTRVRETDSIFWTSIDYAEQEQKSEFYMYGDTDSSDSDDGDYFPGHGPDAHKPGYGKSGQNPR